MDLKVLAHWLLIVTFSLFIVSCGESSESNSDDSSETDTETESETETDPDPEVETEGDTALYQQSFTAADDSAWPAEWVIPTESDSPLTEATIQQNRAYLEGVAGAQRVTRMVMQSIEAQDFEVTFSIQFTSLATQGIGFYGRQNGGRLLGTSPTGQGYAVFIEGYSHSGSDLNLTLWHELDGDEDRDTATRMTELIAANDQVYRVRFRVEQAVENVSTELNARIWRIEDDEPD